MESASGDGWWNELKKYWNKIQDETKLSLQLIKRDRTRNGLLFDEKFKNNFLRTTYTKIGDSFEQFLRDEHCTEQLSNDIDVEQRDQVIEVKMDILQHSMIRMPDNVRNEEQIQPVALSSNIIVAVKDCEQTSKDIDDGELSGKGDLLKAPYVERIDLISEQEVEEIEEEKAMSHHVNATKEFGNVVDRLPRKINDKINVSGQLKMKHKSSNAVDTKKRFQCDYCDYSADTKQHFNYHIRTHTNERPYECKVCEKWFTQSGNLSRHMKTHRDMFAYQCLNCRQGFSHETPWKLHEKRCKANGYECHLCKAVFIQKHQVVDHMRKHTRGKFR